MRGQPTDFWGKLRRPPAPGSDDVIDPAAGPVEAGWHPLVDHCADVAACAEVLLTHTVLGERLARLTGRERLPERELARLLVLTAAHDIGKLSTPFQARAFGGGRAGHVTEGLSLFDPLGANQPTFRALARAARFAEIEDWGEYAVPVFHASICHHGSPQVLEDARFEARSWQPLRLTPTAPALDPVHGLAALMAATAVWFPAAWVDQEDTHPWPTAAVHAFCGVVTLADWLGSDSHPARFPYRGEHDAPSGAEERFAFARERALAAAAGVGLIGARARAAVPGGPPSLAHLGQPYPMRPLQAAIADLPPPRSGRGSVVIAEAPTGDGKTEAALLHCLNLWRAGAVDGLYFALPTRTAAVQLHARVHRALTAALGAACPGVVLAVPGYLRVDGDEGVRLAPFETLWPDRAEESSAHHHWAAEQPKRYLAAGVAVGTVDQALLAGLATRHAHLRFAGLLRTLLVVDEVHASDAYMGRLLAHLLENHVAAGGHALLLSATLGSPLRTRLLTAAGGRAAALDLPAAVALPYPLISQVGLAGPAEIAVPVVAAAREISVQLEGDLTPEAVARQALEAARQGARVLVVRNTVRSCVDTQLALEALGPEAALLLQVAGQPVPHHGRFAPEDRRRLDDALLARLGKEAPRAVGCIVVATQTVEQSLDLDADLLVTDLCPMDVLIQRLGRLHRHDRPRPPGFERPRAVVLAPTEGLLPDARGHLRAGQGWGSVYADGRILELTRRQLAEHPTLRLPDEARARLEATVHPTVFRALEAEQPVWAAHAREVEGAVLADATQAGMSRLRFDRDLYAPAGQFPLHGRPSTRLGQQDVSLPLPVGTLGPFGPVDALKVPAHLWPKVSLAGRQLEASIQPESGGFVVHASAISAIENGAPSGAPQARTACPPLRYDRLGLRLDDIEIAPVDDRAVRLAPADASSRMPAHADVAAGPRPARPATTEAPLHPAPAAPQGVADV